MIASIRRENLSLTTESEIAGKNQNLLSSVINCEIEDLASVRHPRL